MTTNTTKHSGPTTLNDLRAEDRPLDIVVRGMPIHLTYSPDGLSVAHLRAVEARPDADASETAVLLYQAAPAAAMLASMLVSWDLLESDGKTPVPLTQERLERFGLSLLTDLANAVSAAIQAQKAQAQPKSQRKPARRREARKVAD